MYRQISQRLVSVPPIYCTSLFDVLHFIQRGWPNATFLGCRVGWTDSTEEERERVIKILLERNDVNPGSADKSGRTWKIMIG